MMFVTHARANFGFEQDILKAHYAAIVGLPAGAAVSFILVVLLRQTEGPIEFEGLTFKFQGASGQVECGSSASWLLLAQLSCVGNK